MSLSYLLSKAIEQNNLDAVRQLLRRGVSPNSVNTGIPVLFLATSLGCADIVKILLSSGADVNKADNSTGATPLYVAAQEGHINILKILLESGAEVDKSRTNGATPLMSAAANNHTEIVKVLLESGADVNRARTDNGMTPLYVASQKGNTDIVKILLKSGADVNKARTTGATPLLGAAANGRADIVKILLSSGADVNKACTDTGATPLYVAAQEGHSAIVKILLDSGAEVNRTRTSGATPLYVAAQQGHTEVVKILLSSGADPFITFNSLTPRNIAETKNNYMEIVNLLSEHELSWNQQITQAKSLTTTNKSNFATRVMNISTQDMKPLPPLLLWLDSIPLSTLDECIRDLMEVEVEGKKVFPRLSLTVSTVLKTVNNMKMDDSQTSNLTLDERAAIYIYTMELPKLNNGSNGSIYYLLNEFLRNQDRNSLQPFLKYLKLLLSALCKLPPVNAKVCRGVKADMQQYLKSKEKKEIVWNSFSSTTLNSKTLDNPMFLGSSGQRAAFFIDCKGGRSIKHLSANSSEDEVLMLPCSCFRVEHVLLQGDLTVVHLTELDPHEDFALLFGTNSVTTNTNQRIPLTDDSTLVLRHQSELALDETIKLFKRRIDEIRDQLPLEENLLAQILSKELSKAEQSYTSQSHTTLDHLQKLKELMEQQAHQLKEDNKRSSEEICRKIVKKLKAPLKDLIGLQSEELLNLCQAAVASFEEKGIGPAKSAFRKQLLQFCETQKKAYRMLMKVYLFSQNFTFDTFQKLEEEKEILTQQITELEAKVNDYQAENQRIESKNQQLGRENALLAAKKQLLEETQKRMELENQQTGVQQRLLADQVGVLKSEKQQMETQQKLLSNQVSVLKSEKQQMELQLQRNAAKLQDTEIQKQQLEKQKQQFAEQVHILEEKQKRLESEKQQLEALHQWRAQRLQNIELKYQQLEKQNELLTSKIRSLEDKQRAMITEEDKSVMLSKQYQLEEQNRQLAEKLCVIESEKQWMESQYKQRLRSVESEKERLTDELKQEKRKKSSPRSSPNSIYCGAITTRGTPCKNLRDSCPYH